ncbi:CIC11C00000000084 [Sungouiella intermedia]|uniref:CIC11C00000000084 n=1 Tax=Sungouiella intermedia TaxID=45354 RepID=A0A1L0DJQ5_9ASCO|nr:CIC11C00000000084 [[Candida] intermedia]
MFSVDVDEADVAVLSQNLAKSKDLFRNIASSLQNISSKTLTASRNIRPVLTEFNTLTSKKTRVEEGLQLLQDVSEYSSRAADAQRILNGPIENAGTQNT